MSLATEVNAASGQCAVRTSTNSDERGILSEFMQRYAACEVVEFAPKDDDDLDVELCSGRFDRVVFANLDAVFSAIWKGHARVDRWVAAGVRIELADSADGDSASSQAFVIAMYESLARWRKGQRRRQVMTVIILSVLALLAIAVLFLWTPIPG